MIVNLLDDVAPASNEIGALTEAATRLKEHQENILRLEDELKLEKQSAKEISEQELPDLMTELNCKKFSLLDGCQVEVLDIVSASIPSAGAIDRAKGDNREELYERQQQAFEWLRKNGGGDLIKSNVEIQFGKGEDDRCTEFKKDLRQRRFFYHDSMGVHPQVLKAFIKECLTSGKNVPPEIFKLYTGQKVQIRRP